MAFRRHELTQRRKAVGFTQESLAEHLGVERSTVIRWEAGDSEPLPSIRPSLARALQVSIDQLAELLAASEDEDATRTLSADPEGTAPVLFPVVQPSGRPGGPELANLIHPQVAEAVEALRRALRSADVSTEDLAAMLLIGGSSRVPPGAPGSEVPDPLHTETPNLPAPAAIPPDLKLAEVQRHRASSRRRTRFAAAVLFAFALPAIWLSAPFEFSHSGASPHSGARTPESAAPVVAIPVPSPGSGPGGADATGAVNTAPVVTPSGGPAPPAATVVPAAPTTRATGNSRTVRRPARPAARTRPPAWVVPAGDRWNGFSQIERFAHLW